ncbi:2-keto-4-pentenoate hydratase [Luteimonas sp. SJ-16]|uniref:2-keto-4-pentenoate hydratase n=1 Tax=Luteimonas deserti TaxID=2752306 RepID=A0A7Z0QPH3_9GAMM|nr:2-keto-4-pentenoate hydratase [Luteimonas deserti]NYZ62308.1 2-keto-4-pentenoate hydratase [Luteimonas deserti]
MVDAFLAARRAGRSLPEFPGEIPVDLEAAYAVQDQAIAHWPDALVGWKVGYIAPEKRDASGDDRLLGPVFRSRLQQAGEASGFEVFSGGFGAIEAEYVLRLDADAPGDKTEWTPDEAAALASTLFIGLEVASSPLATINQLGPRVVVSDFGNNNGLVVGAEIADWTARDEASLTAASWIDDVCVGTGGATTLPGGLRAAFAFALARSARRGRPLKAGDLVATGNATGIHDILPGQRARVVFDGHGEIVLTARAATPVAEERVA